MSGQDANMADCRQSKTRPQWCHFSTLTESISQTAVEGEGWLKRFKGRQLITSPSLMSLAPHTLRESLHNFVILLRLSYLFYFFCLPPAELLIFYLRKKRKKPWNLNQELKADHKLCSLLMKINSLRQKWTYLLFVQTCFLSLICFTFVQICIILYREHVAEYNNLKSKFILHNKI